MKKILLFALLVPAFAFAQKIEISEIAGYSSNLSNNFFRKLGGVSNQLSASYSISKHISAGAYYEYNAWKPNTNAVGLLADARFDQFYFGVNGGVLLFDPYNVTHYVMYVDPAIVNYAGTGKTGTGGIPASTYKEVRSVTINPAIVYGIHAGLNQHLGKHLTLKEQVGYSRAHSSGTYYGDHMSVKVNCASALVGVAYGF